MEASARLRHSSPQGPQCLYVSELLSGARSQNNRRYRPNLSPMSGYLAVGFSQADLQLPPEAGGDAWGKPGFQERACCSPKLLAVAQ